MSRQREIGLANIDPINLLFFLVNLICNFRMDEPSQLFLLSIFW